MLTSRYIAGEGAAVIRSNGATIVASGISDDAASVLWKKTEQYIAGDAVTAILAHFGHDDLPFASIAVSGATLHILVRGGARVEAQTADGDVHVVASGEATTERGEIDDVLRATLLLPEESPRLGEGWHVESGLVGASQVTAIVDATSASDSAGDDLADELEVTVIASETRPAVPEKPADADLIRELVSAVDWSQATTLTDDDPLTPSVVPEERALSAPLTVVLATGLVVPLDRPVVMGRAPMYSRALGGDSPRLLAFDSPARDISRTHVQISEENGRAIVTDLHSTNGVFVTYPGHEAVRIAPNEPTPVEPGTVVDIGEGAAFVIREPA